MQKHKILPMKMPKQKKQKNNFAKKIFSKIQKSNTIFVTGDNAKAQDTSNEDAKAVKSTNGFKEEEESKEDATNVTKVTKEYT